MKTLTLVILLAACSKDEGKEVIAKLADFEKAMCACPDEACAKKVSAEHKAYLDGGAMKKPTDKQMNTVMDTEERIDQCEAKFVLSETGTMMLEGMKKELASAKEKVAAGKYVETSMSCSQLSVDQFQKNYGAIATTKPEIKAFLDEYSAYCKDGMHLEAVTALVTKAEAARADTVEAHLQACQTSVMTFAEIKLKDVPGGPEKLAPLKERFAKACAK
jgi:hypothetical protein